MCVTATAPLPVGEDARTEGSGAHPTGVLRLLPPPDLEHLTEALDSISPQRGAALRVMEVMNDPRSGSAQVAEALSCDTTLATRVLRTANSAYYGLGGRVPTVARAVTVVGFETIQSLVGIALAGLDSNAHPPPDGFWDEATRVATTARLLAPRLGVPPPQAFCAGLLHDLGAAVLHRLSPERSDVVTRRVHAGEAASACSAEREIFGMDHTKVAVRLMESWQFPLEVVSSIGQHHGSTSPQALDRLLRLSVVLVEGEPLATEVLRLSEGRVDPDALSGILADVEQQASELAAALAG